MISFNARALSESAIVMREFRWYLMSKFC
jgi:hypothetical protein